MPSVVIHDVTWNLTQFRLIGMIHVTGVKWAELRGGSEIRRLSSLEDELFASDSKPAGFSAGWVGWGPVDIWKFIELMILNKYIFPINELFMLATWIEGIFWEIYWIIFKLYYY